MLWCANWNFLESVANLCEKIAEVLVKTGDSIEEIKKRARLAVPLLKSIEDSLSVNQTFANYTLINTAISRSSPKAH